MQSKLDEFGYPVRRDPPLPQLDKPDPVTVHDLSPEDRARVIINPGGNYASSSWKFRDE